MDAKYLERYAYMPVGVFTDAIGQAALDGARVLELGPGDNLLTGLLMLSHGAQSYIALDRFGGAASTANAKRSYTALVNDLRARFPACAERLAARGISPDAFPEGYGDVVRVVNRAIEDDLPLEPASLDLICSFNVVEHLQDMAVFARRSFALLRPGAMAVHRVDFGPHSWGRWGDDIAWLTVPDYLWQLMGSHRGTPNRMRVHEVEAELERAGFRVTVDATAVFGEELLRENVHRLTKRFRTMPIESLNVRAATITCEKPA